MACHLALGPIILLVSDSLRSHEPQEIESEKRVGARIQRRTRARRSAASETSASNHFTVDANSPSDALPSAGIRTWLSIWVCFHLVALFLSFTSVVEPSTLHARLSELVHPYLMVGHFAADDRPVYLAHGSESEQPHRLQITVDDLTEIDDVETCQWQAVGAGDYDAADASPGLDVSDRVARWLATAATLSENDQPGVVADLLLPIAQHFPDAKAIRIVRFPTDLSDVNATSESPYVARIVRSDDLVSLIQLNPKRLSSQAVANAKESAE